jgi:ATP-dependent Clp protease, protease subunit
MMHQPISSFFEAKAKEVILETEELLELRENITNVYVQRTGQPNWVIAEDMERDIFLSAAEAKAYGIVDAVGLDLSGEGLMLNDYITIDL